MAKKSLKKIFIGLFFISFSIVLLFFAFYFLEVRPKLAQREKERLSKQALQVKEDETPSYDYKEVVITEEETKEEVAPEKEALVEQKVIYSDKEQAGAEGFLWIDRKASKYVVTLGSANGLSAGRILAVYDGDTKIGEVTVTTSFDVISYVDPSAELLKKFKNDYYKVVIRP